MSNLTHFYATATIRADTGKLVLRCPACGVSEDAYPSQQQRRTISNYCSECDTVTEFANPLYRTPPKKHHAKLLFVFFLCVLYLIFCFTQIA
jgi:hypothetical protein